ncbi:type 1 periplasmic-binding domain-containing protein [Azohydromonas lata]|uniref:Branched-chain amino acid ABC transporter substrate-binding protein n=1 Tax=Azohydromonas lata TaxID=45677 RepID=A0ABU5IDX5_9BURK|nr:branched-chain amino acid ABC transporter substrate-binding protein [Azohydromonas lata]MDZ5457178.1 branched-chain amino acid ABC transporter substrate-binding protein [Azohydromonas lata]
MRLRPPLSLLAAAAALLAAATAQAAPYKVTLLVRADDARLERNRVERAYLGHPGGPAGDGLGVALKEAAFELDAAGTAITVDTVPVADAAAARAAAQKAEKAGAAVLLTDLDAAATLAVADAVQRPVLNLGAADDRLRGPDCRPKLLHLAPSERMRADALAQTLAARKWPQVLLLTGPSPLDAERSAVAQAAIKRYGLKLAAVKPFKLSADPRERNLANPLLLTGGVAYDAVWVVDSDGEFARTLPYRTALPRPVVGDGGLVPVAWHAQFERFGAPQVSRRFQKAANRPMTGADWAAWMAGKALVAAAVAVPKGPQANFEKALAEGSVDGSKGVVMSFRPWDGQLRQPLLLTDGQGVISTAPIEGVLHPKNVLDTLGADAPEKLCKVRP